MSFLDNLENNLKALESRDERDPQTLAREAAAREAARSLALEIAPHDCELGAVIAERLGEIEGFFRKCIKGAQADGTAPGGIDAKDVARLFLGVLLGIRVLARSNPDRSLLEGVVRPALAILDSPRNQGKKTR